MVLPGPGDRRCGRGWHDRRASERAVLMDEQAPADLGQAGSNGDALGVSGRAVVLPRWKFVALHLGILICTTQTPGTLLVQGLLVATIGIGYSCEYLPNVLCESREIHSGSTESLLRSVGSFLASDKSLLESVV